MVYQVMNRLKPQGRLTPEELCVMDALSDYNWDMSENSLDDFVPMSVVYDDYLRFMRGIKADHLPLTRIQFGVALRLVRSG